MNFDAKASTWDQSNEKFVRAQQIANEIMQSIDLKHVSSVLDFGCGTGLLGFNFVNHVKKVTFADISKGMLEQVKIKAETNNIKNYQILDLGDTELIENYDLIISLLALHHVEDLARTLDKLISKLNQNGYFCLCDVDTEDGSFHYPAVVPHNGIDRNQIVEILEKRGIRIEQNVTVHKMLKTVNAQVKEYSIFMILGRRVSC